MGAHTDWFVPRIVDRVELLSLSMSTTTILTEFKSLHATISALLTKMLLVSVSGLTGATTVVSVGPQLELAKEVSTLNSICASLTAREAALKRCHYHQSSSSAAPDSAHIVHNGGAAKPVDTANCTNAAAASLPVLPSGRTGKALSVLSLLSLLSCLGSACLSNQQQKGRVSCSVD
jgi:hypothetical protein